MLDAIDDSVILLRPTGLDPALLAGLVAGDVISPLDSDRAMAAARRLDVPVADVLLRQLDLDPVMLARHQARLYRVKQIDPSNRPPDPLLVDQIGAQACLRRGILPWRRFGGLTVILTSRPDEFAAQQADLEQIFGNLRMAVTTEVALTDAIVALYGPALTAQAENFVPATESCRNWDTARASRIAAGGLVLLAALAMAAPVTLFMTILVGAMAVLAVITALKVAAAILCLRAPPPPLAPVAEPDLPVITILVPLYRETAIASHLLVRLAALRYPRAKMDICLVLEQDDATTRATLARTRLPGWIRAVTVPPGQVRTKPRAMNYALPFARGSIIGVWDAEDAPAPDQLHVVARHFAHAAPDVACLQGVLDYYNTGTNWLTRCFTIEYAAWFQVVLPGLARMRLVVPLGGTTLFFRRDALVALGAWDAHNVTEDADLGLRLARHGYTTALIPTVTLEEANGRAWPWVKQRSRWLKGYAITYCVHMRNPVLLLRDLGLWRFIGVQIMFAGTLCLFALMPLFWSLWLLPLGLGHPLQDWLSPAVFTAVWVGFFLSEIMALLVNLAGLHKAGKQHLWGWALTLPVYFPLGALAAYRGLAELAHRPFYWDKTAHGVIQAGPRYSAASTAAASSFNRVTKAAEI